MSATDLSQFTSKTDVPNMMWWVRAQHDTLDAMVEVKAGLVKSTAIKLSTMHMDATVRVYVGLPKYNCIRAIYKAGKLVEDNSGMPTVIYDLTKKDKGSMALLKWRCVIH